MDNNWPTLVRIHYFYDTLNLEFHCSENFFSIVDLKPAGTKKGKKINEMVVVITVSANTTLCVAALARPTPD